MVSAIHGVDDKLQEAHLDNLSHLEMIETSRCTDQHSVARIICNLNFVFKRDFFWICPKFLSNKIFGSHIKYGIWNFLVLPKSFYWRPPYKQSHTCWSRSAGHNKGWFRRLSGKRRAKKSGYFSWHLLLGVWAPLMALFSIFKTQ